MRNLAAGAALVFLLVMSNVVAAGVFQVLAPIAQVIEDEDLQLLALGAVGGAAVGAALCFLLGSLRAVVASLQSAPRQRGG